MPISNLPFHKSKGKETVSSPINSSAKKEKGKCGFITKGVKFLQAKLMKKVKRKPCGSFDEQPTEVTNIKSHPHQDPEAARWAS